MKRLLAGGYPDIYAICRVFRDGEAGRLHQPEFTMVEWYRQGFGLRAMIDETVAFIADILGRPALLEALSLEYEENPQNPLDEIRECIRVAREAMGQA